jgi:type VII secretion protein EccE
LPIAELTAVLTEGGLRGARLQIVTHAVPAPTSSLPPGCPAFSSYQDLPGAATVAAQRYTWIAVRLPALAAADAAASRGGGPNGVGKALAAIVGRIAKVLAGVGIDYRILDTVGLTEALARCCGVDAAPTTQDARVDEGWDRLLADGVAYASLAVTRWPPQRPGAPGLLSVLARVPAATTTLSVSLEDADDGAVSIRTLLRVAAAPTTQHAAVEAAETSATQAGGRLRPLYGQQAAAMYAAAPTGGGVR